MDKQIFTASITVEAAYIIPFILLITIGSIHLTLQLSKSILEQTQKHIMEEHEFYQSFYFEEIELGVIDYKQRLARDVIQINVPEKMTREEKTRLISILLKPK